MLYGYLPRVYWQHYCKLVMAMRLVHQRSITITQVRLIDKLLISYYKEFETLYYQRDPERIHFVRQSIHALLHVSPEVLRMGPQAYYAQWTMERTIGNLGQEIKQPSNPFANLSRRAILRAQVNALQGACSSLNPPLCLPRGAQDVGDGYVLLRAWDRYYYHVKKPFAAVISDFWNLYQAPGSPPWIPRLKR